MAKNEDFKVKTFQVENGKVEDLDKEMNLWFNMNQGIEVLDRQQTESCATYGEEICWNLTVSILYHPISYKPKKG